MSHFLSNQIELFDFSSLWYFEYWYE